MLLQDTTCNLWSYTLKLQLHMKQQLGPAATTLPLQADAWPLSCTVV